MLLDSSLQQPQVGYALGRSFGSAVERNRFRRRLRELVKGHESRLGSGVYVFGASPRASELDFGSLGRQLDALIAKLPEGPR